MTTENNDPEINFITIKGVKLAYRQLNPQGERTILLLHGLAESSAFFWQDIFSTFGTRYRIIAFDLLGHGQTTAYAKDYSPYFQAEIIQSAIQSLGVEKAILIAHSFGGTVGIAMAVKNPASIEKLVLYSTPVSRGLLNTVSELVGEVSILSLLPGLPMLLPYSGQIMKLLPESVQKIIFQVIFWQWGIPYSGNKLTVSKYRPELVREAVNTSGVGLERMIRKTFLLTKMIHLLGEISQPVLLIKGSRDFILSDRMANNYAQLIKRSRLVILSETSHVSLLDRPDEFIKVIEEFLGE